MTRRCSHCSHNGHNSRTCPTRGGPKLFGVRLMDGPMKKSASMGNLSSAHYLSSSSSPNPSSPSSDPLRDPNPALAQGYVSDDPAHASCSSNCRAERKKVTPYEGSVGCTEIRTICLYSGILLPLKCTLKVTGTPWTEEEHRRFLVGLQKLGKGDWRGIARNYVVSRTPTQVASHAQKYFIRQNNSGRRKRRSSLFDMVPDMSSDAHPVLEEQFGLPSSAAETEEINRLPSLSLALDRGCEPMESTLDDHPVEPEETIACSQLPPVVPAFIPAYVPVLYPFWPPNMPLAGEERKETHQILRPIPVHSKNPANVDDLASMSKLSLREVVAGRIEPSALSLELHGAPSRQSAFHANSTVGGPELSQSNSNIIHAV